MSTACRLLFVAGEDVQPVVVTAEKQHAIAETLLYQTVLLCSLWLLYFLWKQIGGVTFGATSDAVSRLLLLCKLDANEAGCIRQCFHVCCVPFEEKFRCLCLKRPIQQRCEPLGSRGTLLCNVFGFFFSSLLAQILAFLRSYRCNAFLRNSI